MMHSSTIAGSMPARRTASAHDERAELRRGEVLERAEELAGRRADGADDDGFAHGLDVQSRLDALRRRLRQAATAAAGGSPASIA